MVSKALQTQRKFLKMVATHQEPAKVRHAHTFSYSMSVAGRVKGINCIVIHLLSHSPVHAAGTPPSSSALPQSRFCRFSNFHRKYGKKHGPPVQPLGLALSTRSVSFNGPLVISQEDLVFSNRGPSSEKLHNNNVMINQIRLFPTAVLYLLLKTPF